MGEEEGGGLNREGGLINFPPLNRGGLLERGGFFERGGLIEDLRYSISLYFQCITTGRWLHQVDANKDAIDTVLTQSIGIRFHHVSRTSPKIYLLEMTLVIYGAENTDDLV